MPPTAEIQEKVMDAIEYLRKEGYGSPSISMVCRTASVSRANLYATYPDLVQIIGEMRRKTTRMAASASRSDNVLRDENAMLKQQIKILAYACVELKSALEQERNKNRLR